MPESAALYCHQLYEKYGFEFQIKKSIQTKLGDYRFDPVSKKNIITINNDLNPYGFLITYLHEVAHLITHNQFKSSVKPHGIEWKNHFKILAAPVLNNLVFPDLLLRKLAAYLKSPKASSCSDPQLYAVLKQYDAPDDTLLLKDLKAGDVFEFKDNTFTYLELRRTRVLCQQHQDDRKYLITKIASVKKIDT